MMSKPLSRRELIGSVAVATTRRIVKTDPKWLSAIERFERYHIPDHTGCWIWYGSGGLTPVHKKRTRPVFGFMGRLWIAARFSYEAFNGPITDGLTVDHICNNELCVNPDHLQLLTGADNTRRYFSAITHCKSGHEFTEENTKIRANGTRQCRECSRIHGRNWHWKNRDTIIQKMKEKYHLKKKGA